MISMVYEGHSQNNFFHKIISFFSVSQNQSKMGFVPIFK